MKKFISMFKAEHYKTKGNIAVLLFLLCPFVAIAGVFIHFAIKTGNTEFDGNPWTYIVYSRLQILYFFYPLLVAVLAYSLCDMEYRNNNFKRLFTLPYPAHTIFISKIAFLIEIVFLSSLIAYSSFILGGFILSHVFPALSFQDYDIRLTCFVFYTRLFISLLAVSFIQFSISLMFRNFVIPVGFGCFMTVFSLIIARNENSYWNPFVAVFNSVTEFVRYESVSFIKHDYACLVCIFVFLFVNYFIFKRHKIRGN